MKKKNIFSWVLSIFIAFVFIQSLFFKFSNSVETQHIFQSIGSWMSGNFLSFISLGFATYGGYIVGVIELITAIFLLIPKLRGFGASIAAIVMAGAIFFHLFTPLGIEVQGDGGLLFIMAVLVFISSVILCFLYREQLKVLFKR